MSRKNFFKDKEGIELGPSTLLLLLILFAAGTAVMLIIMGKWLDLTGYRYKIETQRNAMNLAQLIVTNSPVVKIDNGQPNKLILDADKLDEYEKYAKIGWSPNDMTPERTNWENCCDFLDSDHNFTVHDVVTGKNWTMGNLVFNTNSNCYSERVVGFADLPVVISKDGDNHPGVAVVELMETPLSDLSFWLSQAFIRAYWDDYWNLFPEANEYDVSVPLDPEIRSVSIYENQKRICTNLDKNGDNIVDTVVCKNFVYYTSTSSGSSITFTKDPSLIYTGSCLNVGIKVTRDRTTGKSIVSIIYPG